jgi:ACT domain-containing protein
VQKPPLHRQFELIPEEVLDDSFQQTVEVDEPLMPQTNQKPYK